MFLFNIYRNNDHLYQRGNVNIYYFVLVKRDGFDYKRVNTRLYLLLQ